MVNIAADGEMTRLEERAEGFKLPFWQLLDRLQRDRTRR